MVSAGSLLRCRCSSQAQGGFTYLGVLFAIAIAGIGLAGTGVLWHFESQREKEKELLFVGEQFRQAIGSYYDKSPGADKQFPAKLDDLLLDKRFPMPVRHLRQIFRDPMTSEGDWELIIQQGRIIGVASKSRDKPIKIRGFLPRQESFDSAASYSEWKFLGSGGSGGVLPGQAMVGQQAIEQ